MRSLLGASWLCALQGPAPGEAAASSWPSLPSSGPTTAFALLGSWTQWPSKPSLSRTWVSGCWTVGGRTWWSRQCLFWGLTGSTPWANRYGPLQCLKSLHHVTCPRPRKQQALNRGSLYWRCRVILLVVVVFPLSFYFFKFFKYLVKVSLFIFIEVSRDHCSWNGK